MPPCDFCKHAKPDVQVRPLLRVLDKTGVRTLNPFEGRLCNVCYESARQFGTPAHTWVLNQITGISQQRRNEQ
jgi:hypothetical protein